MHNYFVIIIITCTMYVHSTQYTIMLIIHLQRNKNVISGCNAIAMHLSNEKRFYTRGILSSIRIS